MRRKLLFILVLLFFVGACAGIHGGSLSWDQLTPKGKAAFAMSIYNTEYENYKADVAKPGLTKKEVKFLRKKKEILTKIYPVIQMYANYVQSGMVPPEEVEEQLINLLSLLMKK